MKTLERFWPNPQQWVERIGAIDAAATWEFRRACWAKGRDNSEGLFTRTELEGLNADLDALVRRCINGEATEADLWTVYVLLLSVPHEDHRAYAKAREILAEIASLN